MFNTHFNVFITRKDRKTILHTNFEEMSINFMLKRHVRIINFFDELC